MSEPIEIRTTSSLGADVFLDGVKIGFILARDKEGKQWTPFDGTGFRLDGRDYTREQAADIVFQHHQSAKALQVAREAITMHRYVFAFTLDRELTEEERGILESMLTEVTGDVGEISSKVEGVNVTDAILTLQHSE